MPDPDELKGRVKQAAGDLTGDEDLHREGRTDEAAGKAKRILDEAKDKLDDVVDGIKDRLHRH